MKSNAAGTFSSIHLPPSEILDNLDLGVAICDAEGNYLFVNTTMIRWQNIPREEFLSKNVHDFLPDTDICVFDLVCREKKKMSRLEYYRNLEITEPSPRLRMVTGTPIFDGAGSIQYVITVMQDIRAFEEMYQSLASRNKVISTAFTESLRPDTSMQIVSESRELRHILVLAENIAPLDSNVLLFGESGTGKEIFARLIHEHSTRASHRLVTVNCASIPENLIEAELFGYEKGSFTGANREGRAGLVEAADKGTLFLDEINSLPLSVQGKILRMIEDKSIQRVGSVRPTKVDFRLIAATNQNLATLVQQGKFREDLYYRLTVIPLSIPPIRSRRDDIIPLCRFFLDYFCKKYNLRKTFSPAVYTQLLKYDWPGNVREIRNFVERMVVMTPSQTVEINSIPEGFHSAVSETADITPENRAGMLQPEFPEPRSSSLPARADAASSRPVLTESAIRGALALFHGHRQKTADYLGISRRYLQYKIREYHISSRCRYDESQR
ncbi:MAG: sigma 54-interacting transcriptional regulator [Clostridium sp.]|nr:sigma 54-interacting transcriptional regulator [Clostridium sp.]